jgi:prophage regulatory protein
MQQHSGLLRLREVQRISGLSRSSIYRMEAAGNFPARVQLSERAIAWRADEIHAWIAARPRVAATNSTPP